MKAIIRKALDNSFTYSEYRTEISNLIKIQKSTGHEQSDELLNYSKLNESRMNRLEKTIVLTENSIVKLNNLTKKYIWLVLSEGWCGDAAQILPIIYKMSEVAENVTLKIALRDDNDPLMQQFLTNGGKAVPKVIVLDAENYEVIADWGPRPIGAKQLILDYKTEHGIVDETAKIELQKWYLHDKGISIQNEIMDLMKGKELV